MNDGSMFADLCKYADADFCREHPEIAFDTLSSLGKYEVVAAFKFNTNRETFKYNECPSRLQIQNILGAGHGARNASSEDR